MTWRYSLVAARCLFLAGVATSAEPLQLDPSGPLSDVAEIVFAARLKYDDPHWYANIGHHCAVIYDAIFSDDVRESVQTPGVHKQTARDS
jgi:hypothetical protein